MKGSATKIILIILALVVSVAVVGTAVFLIVKNLDKPDDPVSQGGVGLVIDKDAGEYVIRADNKPQRPNVRIPGWGSMTIPPDTTELNGMVDFFNPEQNAGYYYLTFELRLKNEDGYEVLYKSGLVEAGMHIQSIKISHGLPAGEYSATVHVQPYAVDNLDAPLNCVDANLKLIVK